MRYPTAALTLLAAGSRLSSCLVTALHHRSGISFSAGSARYALQIRARSSFGASTTTEASTIVMSAKDDNAVPSPPRQPQQGGRLFDEELNILYDSKCNVCQLEISFLRSRDLRLHGADAPRLRFTDIEAPGYDGSALANGGVDYEAGMKAMHGILPDGRVLRGVPVFLEAYQRVDLGWLFSVYRVPALKWLLDRGYDLFARYRTNVTRGAGVSELVGAYREKRQLQASQDKQDCETCAAKSSS